LLHFLADQEDLSLAAVRRFIATTARTAEARILGSYSSATRFCWKHRTVGGASCCSRRRCERNGLRFR
jgi:hypothetical protein